MIASHTYRTSAMVGDRVRMEARSPRFFSSAHADEHRTSGDRRDRWLVFPVRRRRLHGKYNPLDAAAGAPGTFRAPGALASVFGLSGFAC
jgi:hypothetical protein